MAEPQATTPTPPAPPPTPTSSTAPDNKTQETAPKQEATTTKAQEQEKREQKPSDAEVLLREVGSKLQAAAEALGGKYQDLAQTASTLGKGTADDIRLNTRAFQHELAYAVQDVEKARGAPLPLSDQARAEVIRLANSAPGLENERLLDLLRSTSKISDQTLVNDIRRTGAEVGQSANQTTTAILSKVESLEGRSRVTARSPEETPTATPPGDPGPSVSRGQPARSETALADSATRPTGPAGSTTPHIVVQEQGGLLNGVLRAMRQSGPTNTPPWEAGVQPFGDRLASFEQKMASGKDEATLKSAEKSGRAALDALEGFRTGEGSVILNRINEAAKSDPNGVAGVLSEMREGGRFADLRKQLNMALSDERGASAAYDKAVGALATYGENRRPSIRSLRDVLTPQH